MLNDGEWPDEVAGSWGVKSSADRETKFREYSLEQAVSAHIRSLPFLWVAVDDEPSSASERGTIEAGAIGLLSNMGTAPIDPASAQWLGLRADRPAVRESGLWNVNHVQGGYDPRFIAVLERRIAAM